MSQRVITIDICDQCGAERSTTREGYPWDEQPEASGDDAPDTWRDLNGQLPGDAKYQARDFCSEACLENFLCVLMGKLEEAR